MKSRLTAKKNLHERKLRPEDEIIWHQVTRTVEVISRKPFELSPSNQPQSLSDLDKGSPGRQKKAAANPVTRAAQSVTASQVTNKPVNGLDRRQQQKLARGNFEIEARIDLHGHSVEQAYMALRTFLRNNRDRGNRNILVITGKGASPFTRHTLHARDVFHAPERQGKLRQEFTRWMQEPEFASHVIGYQPAHPRHGGGGAFYVRLRRKSERI